MKKQLRTCSSSPSKILKFLFCKLCLITLILITILITIPSNVGVESRSVSSNSKKFHHSSSSFSPDYDLLSDDPFLGDPYYRMLSDSPSSFPSHSPSAKLKDLYEALITASKITKTTAERVKMRFVNFKTFFSLTTFFYFVLFEFYELH